jgi:CheY-like chemotaxis protein
MSGQKSDKPLVLTADDDPVTSQILLVYLECSGFEVMSADNGVTALELASANPPDAVILDYNLPPTDGADIARHLRSDPATAGAGIALLTASPELADNASQADLWDARLTKPIDQEYLARVVTELVSASRAARGVTYHADADADADAAPLPDDPIQREFVTRLRAKIGEMRALASSHGDAAEPGSALRVLRRQLGQLHGSANVCGFPEISAVAHEAAALLDRCIDGPAGAVERELDRVRDTIEEIASLVGYRS